jgi:hypothetical protein
MVLIILWVSVNVFQITELNWDMFNTAFASIDSHCRALVDVQGLIWSTYMQCVHACNAYVQSQDNDGIPINFHMAIDALLKV